MSIPVNYFAVEPLLIARITAQLGDDLQKVGGVAEFEATLENDSPYPSAFVLYDGESIEQKGPTGRILRSKQRWQVALLTRPAIAVNTGNASLIESGTLLSRLVDALTGWVPAAGFQALMRTQANGQSVIYANGLAMFTLDFEIGVPMGLGVVP